MIERQELYCHSCGNYVQFDIDTELNGNHILNCPVCGHEHCRVVKDGMITGDRWDSRNGNTIYVGSSFITYSTTSTYTAYTNVTSSSNNSTSSTSIYMYSSWMNTVSYT